MDDSSCNERINGSSQNYRHWMPEGVKKFLQKFEQFERMLVALCLGLMVLMVLVQIFLRNFYQSGVVGGDSLVKHLVLWVGFLGAGLATREASHIRIDIASKILPTPMKPYVQVVVDVFSIVVCSMLLYASYNFVSIEYEGRGTIPFQEIPVWIMEIVIPLGLLIITLRFAAQAVSNFLQIVKGNTH